jgi:putative ABC transport system ATP-binding protein
VTPLFRRPAAGRTPARPTGTPGSSAAAAPDASAAPGSSGSAAFPAARPAPPPGGPALLAAHHLAKAHRTGHGTTTPAVRDVGFEVAPGEFVAVTGPSGAGKSTLLHLLGGLHRPDDGRLLFHGRRVDTLSEAQWAVLRRRHYGIINQGGNLLSDLTVGDNVELPALLAGTPPRVARARRAALLDDLGLTAKTRSGPSELSGGEQQRTALARALVNEPDVLLADEPTGNLDSRSAREVLALLTRYHQAGTAIVLVTHDARVAGSADRVISLFDGRIVDDARLDDTAPDRADGVRRVIELGG